MLMQVKLLRFLTGLFLVFASTAHAVHPLLSDDTGMQGVGVTFRFK